jgi:SAM-dependent methyltransferase
MPSFYRRFWDQVGKSFPDLGGALSTRQYLAGEQRLFRTFLPDLRKQAVLKTDLWDEARNTRILRWAAAEGAIAFGIDIAAPTARAARAEFGDIALHATVADVRHVPFRDGSFDAVYSMGTIEHFPESDQAVRELLRVLRPGGIALIGVPNRHDPFLRPLFVAALGLLGLYAYGEERSFSRRQLRRLVEAEGFEVIGESGILFIPGYLRMAELALHGSLPAAARLLAPALHLFAWLERRFPRLQRHGYLIVAACRKPCS